MSEQEFLCSPESLLASILSQEGKLPELVLITGKSGAGKTTWCQELIRRSQQAGLAPVGLVSPAVFASGVKVGIDLVEIPGGERRRLAVKRELASVHDHAGPSTRGWCFSSEVLAWGNRVLNRLQHPQMIILDELGPLELLENKGLAAGLKRIDGRGYRKAAVVIRPVLVPTALERWPWGLVLDLEGGCPL